MIKNRILLIEDSEADSDLFTKAVEISKWDIEVVVARSGDEALTSMEEYDFDLIVLDLNLPGMHGLDFLAKLKGGHETSVIPILVLSTSDDADDVATAYNNYVNAYLVKPDKFKGYIEIINNIRDYWYQLALLPNHE